MVRSLYSGVAGMITHQTKMDVIGNNIANVSTYGYKSSRATFRDIYYQTNFAASSPTPSTGGKNPTQIGYGSKLGSVDVNHSQSVMSTTGYTLDVAIAGDGYLQVMDTDGNIFYTKAGMLDIDSSGNLVDINGNFVLGVSGSPSDVGPSSNKIKVNLPYESAAAASVTQSINNIVYDINASNENDNGNVNIVFATSTNMPIGQKAQAEITSASIVVTLNANEEFASIEDLNKEMNEAITFANGGARHLGGEFYVTMSNPTAFSEPLTGAEIVNADFGIKSGTVKLTGDLASYFEIKSVGDKFSAMSDSADAKAALSISINGTDGNEVMTLTMGKYTAQVTREQMKNAGTVVMKRNDLTPLDPDYSTDSFVISYPRYDTIDSQSLTSLTAQAEFTPSEPSRCLGLGDGNFLLTGGTEGGEQTTSDLTGISINNRGVITATHKTMGLIEIGRIDLAIFDNPAGLTQAGNTYFSVSQNSGDPRIVQAGTDGAGEILGSTLETSNVDLSHEFSDMITTQRGFQACSRLITVSDTMLEELINLKR